MDDAEDQLFVDDIAGVQEIDAECAKDLTDTNNEELFLSNSDKPIDLEQVQRSYDDAIRTIDFSASRAIQEQSVPLHHFEGVPRDDDSGANVTPKDSCNNTPHVLDRVQLASILKDFDAKEDPLFKDTPEYISIIVREMLESDFLLVLGRGLGLPQVLNLFLAKVNQQDPKALTLVFGRLSEDEDDVAENEQLEDSSEQGETIGFNIVSAKRAKLYQKGGIYNITGPIAVVDILTGILDCSRISGLVIAHGEYVSEHSTIAFAIRLVKKQNPMAFIKILSDSPERLILPPSLPFKLRYLGVPTIMLWPRFHMLVDKSLPRLDVEEIIVEQTLSVRRQQALLTELTQAILSDVKRRVPNLDVDYLAPALGPQQTHENPDQLHAKTNADSIMASPDLAWRIRNALQGVWHQLSNDGRSSVHSLSTLQQLQQTLIQYDARTFYSQLDLACRNTSQPWTDLPVVSALLAEARRSAALQRMPGKFYHVRDLLKSFNSGSHVLLLCDSLKTVYDLYIYLNRNEEDNAEQEQALRDLENEMKSRDDEEQRKKLAEEAAKVNAGRKGRRRIRGGGTSSSVSEIKSELSDDLKDKNNISTKDTIESSRTTEKRRFEEIDLTFSDDNEQEELFEDQITSSYESLKVSFTTYRNAKPLNLIKPTHIIMYDPSQLFTREIERYIAGKKNKAHVEIYFMYYQQSIEELQYLTSMRREKDSFSRLIREKGLMPMYLVDGEPEQHSEGFESTKLLGNSRRTYEVIKKRPCVVVDIREFRSALPFHIWQVQMNVVPLTLLVGDYVLTPDIVVERKSVADLIGSFRDGRLYQQCESMLKHYKIAALLIEFDNKSHFTMEPFKDIRNKTANVKREIQENICTLMLRFPRLKLIWSSSPVHSAQIFQTLKEMEDEPDPDTCAQAGQSMMMESASLSMLEAMPGLNPYNAQLIAKKISTITGLCDMSFNELADTIGHENATKLWQFLCSERGDKVVQ